MLDLHIDLDAASGGSLRARVEQALRDAIRGGRLAPGTRLPSTRSLCVELGVSRGVVAEAYAQLTAEGYLRARRGAGTTVSEAASGATPERKRVDAPSPPLHDMSPFRPALADFPRGTWVAALTRAARSVPDARLGYPDPAGAVELRETLASYLGRARGVRADPDQILVCSGLRQGFSLLLSVLAAEGASTIAVERPGWRGMSETAADAGLSCVGVKVDEDGLDVEALRRSRADAVAVAPAHQYPTAAGPDGGAQSLYFRSCALSAAPNSTGVTSSATSTLRTVCHLAPRSPRSRRPMNVGNTRSLWARPSCVRPAS